MKYQNIIAILYTAFMNFKTSRWNIFRFAMAFNSSSAMFFLIILSIASCRDKGSTYDATGTFESTEIIVSAEVTGKILLFSSEEGASLRRGDTLVVIDNTNLSIQKEQAEASVDAVSLKQNSAAPQIEIFNQQYQSAEAQLATLQTQMQVLTKEQNRVVNLYKAEAATSQQLDDINGKVDILQKQIISAQKQQQVIKSQIKAAKDQVAIQNRGISSEKKPLEKKVALLEEQLEKSTVINPTAGTLLTKYANTGELIMAGKPLYKLADLSVMTLRAYITGDQLGAVKIGEGLNIYIDAGSNEYKQYQGVVKWVSDKAEFTPKSIQTKDERANLVYAVKIDVKNDGFIKIGMYGEVELNKSTNN